jgi:hypothetical protein
MNCSPDLPVSRSDAQLAVIPGRDQFTLVEQSAPLMSMLHEFLSAPCRLPGESDIR